MLPKINPINIAISMKLFYQCLIKTRAEGHRDKKKV